MSWSRPGMTSQQSARASAMALTGPRQVGVRLASSGDPLGAPPASARPSAVGTVVGVGLLAVTAWYLFGGSGGGVAASAGPVASGFDDEKPRDWIVQILDARGRVVHQMRDARQPLAEARHLAMGAARPDSRTAAELGIAPAGWVVREARSGRIAERSE